MGMFQVYGEHRVSEDEIGHPQRVLPVSHFSDDFLRRPGPDLSSLLQRICAIVHTRIRTTAAGDDRQNRLLAAKQPEPRRCHRKNQIPGRKGQVVEGHRSRPRDRAFKGAEGIRVDGVSLEEHLGFALDHESPPLKIGGRQGGREGTDYADRDAVGDDGVDGVQFSFVADDGRRHQAEIETLAFRPIPRIGHVMALIPQDPCRVDTMQRRPIDLIGKQPRDCAAD